MKNTVQGYRYGKKWGKPTKETCTHIGNTEPVGVSSVDNDWYCKLCGKSWKTKK